MCILLSHHVVADIVIMIRYRVHGKLNFSERETAKRRTVQISLNNVSNGLHVPGFDVQTWYFNHFMLEGLSQFVGLSLIGL